MEKLLDFLSESENPILRALFWIISIILILLCIAVIGLVVIIVGLIIWSIATSHTSSDGSFTYRKSDGQITLNRYNGTEIAIVLPVEVDGMPVASFLQMTDKNDVVEEITIPDELTYSFDVNNPMAFFSDFPVLQNIRVSDTHPNLKVIDGVLYTRDGTVLLAYPAGRTGEAVIPEGVEIIWYGAFRNSSVSSIVLPESLHTICDFAMCDFRVMRFLEIPEGVTSISPNAFKNGDINSRKLQFIVTQDSVAHQFLLEHEAPIREVLPATQAPVTPADPPALAPAA